MQRPPFDRFRPPFLQRPPFYPFPPGGPPRPRFDVRIGPQMHPFPGGPRMLPPPFMPPPFPPNPQRPFLLNSPRLPPPFNSSQMRPPGDPRMFPPRFRISGGCSQLPVLPGVPPHKPAPSSSSSPSTHLRPSMSASCLSSPQGNLITHQLKNIHNFSRFKSRSDSNLVNEDTRSEWRSQDHSGFNFKRKDIQMSKHPYKRPKDSFQDAVPIKTEGDSGGSNNNNTNNKTTTTSNNFRKNNNNNNHNNKKTNNNKNGDGGDDDERRIESEAREWESLMESYKEDVVPDWVRCSPANLCFRRDSRRQQVESTRRMLELERCFEVELLQRAAKIREGRPAVVMPERYYNKYQKKKRKSGNRGDEVEDEEEENEGDGGGDDDDECDNKMSIIAWKNQHPELLHSEMWYNLPGEMNDGPLCRCSKTTRTHGIRHNIYPGEESIGSCKPHSSNSQSLFHYKITMSPHTNFLTRNPTVVNHDDHEFIFEGFSLFSHYRINKVPTCKVIRFNIEYTIHWFEEDMVENFDVRSLDLFSDYIYREVLELVDLDWIGKHCKEGDEGGGVGDEGGGVGDEGGGVGDEGGVEGREKDGGEGKEKVGGEGKEKGCSSNCRAFHIMPRFSRNLPDNGKEILSMNEVLNFMLRSNRPLMDDKQLQEMMLMSDSQWQNFVDQVRGMIVIYPGKRPSSLRIDQLDRTQESEDSIQFPKIIHFGYRPAQLSYVGDAVYSKLFKQYMKLKYLVANKPKLSPKDREKLRSLENQLQEIRLKGWLKREMTVEVSSESFHRTGLKSDICQHALLLPVLLQHLRFHKCLDVLEKNIGHQFADRLYLQMAMTHPSFRMNYGTNPDHARNSLSNCGMRQLEYGDRHIHYIHTRKRGIKTLIHIMSKMARIRETASEIHHYERLEFLGDTVIEFLSSIHLFFLFPRLEEGGLATFRAALVQNQHLTVLAQKLGLQHYLLYAHGPDLCRDSDLRYALANCFEALMGSLYLDGGIEEADRIFGEALFKDNSKLHHVWTNLPCHRLQEDEPMGDRHWVQKSKPLQKLVEFEEVSGIRFNHIRLLARAFTMRNIGYNNLSLGHNQTLEFLGDTILQFITSEYLFKHFPDHHEGHLTLLRSSLVNNKTQAIICDDLGMTSYVINNDPKVKERMENEKNKVKDKADILEAFMGALYVDQGLDPCIVFCQVCFYPRLKEFIMNQDWNDAKSQLQQCCLTLRDPTEGEPDIPIYKVLQCTGPTNTRKYHVAVYFKGERLATGVGHSIQQGEMEAATNALKQNSDMFPHLLQTKQYLDWRFNKYFNSHVENKVSLHKTVQSRFKIDRRHLNKPEDKKSAV